MPGLKIILVIFLSCCSLAAGAQAILLTRAEVLKLPCKILKNAKGDVVGGYFNEKDSSLYSCRGNFKRTLPGGYVPVDTLGCATAKLPPLPRGACPIGYLSSIVFKPGSMELTSGARAILASAAVLLSADSVCAVKVAGYFADSASKNARQLNWDRVNTIIKFLVEKQDVPQNRILFSYDVAGPVNTVDLLPETIEMPGTLKKKKTIKQ